MRGEDLIQAREEFGLELLVLARSLDRDVRVESGGEAFLWLYPVRDLARRLCREPIFFHLAAEVALDRNSPAVDGRAVDVVEQHGMTRRRAHLRDTAAHLPCTHH